MCDLGEPNGVVVNFLRIWLLCIIPCFLGTGYLSFGQQQEGMAFHFSHLSVNEGLSQSTVLSIHQDQFGFMWVGTRDGLNKYDGYSFEVFKHAVNDSTSIAGNIIYDIQADSNGNIWVVTENGLSKYDRKWNVFHNYSLPKREFETSSLQVLWIDRAENIWVGGRHGLFLFDEKEGRFTTDFIAGEESAVRRMGFVSSIYEDEAGNLWVGTTRLGIYRLNKKKRTFERLHTEFVANTDNSRVEALLVGKDGQVWVGTYGNGLFLIDAAGNLLHRYHHEAEAGRYKLSNSNIRTLELDDDDRLWVGTFDGLDIIDNGQIVKQIRYQEGNVRGLSHSSIRAIFKDRKGTMWIGTYFGGVNLFDEDDQQFRHFYHRPFDHRSLSYNVVGAFTETGSGDLIIGTERGGINFFDRRLSVHKHQARPNSTIKSLLNDKDGRVWVGVFRGGLQLFNPNDYTLKRYPSANQLDYQSMREAIVNCIVEDPQGGLWLGTDNKGGVFYFNTETERFEHFFGQDTLQDYLNNHAVKSIYLAPDGQLLLATKGKGIVMFDRHTAQIDQYDRLLNDGASAFVDEFNHIFADKSGILWFASSGAGVFSYNPGTGEVDAIHTGDGLANNIVMGTMQDNDGYLWFVTLNGLTKYDANGSQILKNYHYSSGFPLEEINEGAFYKTTDGSFLIGGSNGYTIMDPLNLRDNAYLPPVLITDIRVSNKRVLPGDGTGILEQELHKTESITLRHTQSILTLDFAALNFIRPENNQYAYMLQGFDDEWIYSQNRRSATYTRLPAGVYTFMVKGSNNDGVWNTEPLELQIVMLPPPWRTWWAYCIYVVLIVIGFLVIRYNAVKSTQLKHNLRLEQLEKEKLKEIHELKLSYFIDVSHEFRTPLTLIVSPLEEIVSARVGNEWLKSRLKVMLFNAKRLLLLIDQILEIRELESGHHVIQHKPLFLSSVMQEIIDSFKGLADKQQISLRYRERKIDELPLLIDQDKLEKVFFNLLSNAFKFTPEGGEIAITVSARDHVYYFEVKDTGQGIDEAIIERVFDRFFQNGKNNYGAGIGLSVTKLLVEVMGGTIRVESKRNAGTRFFITLPLRPAPNGGLEPASAPAFQKPVPLEYQHAVLEGKQEVKGQPEKETLLVVEDNKDLKAYLVDQLSAEYDVVTANNGEKGLKKARRTGPALIVSDVMMPKMDGFELCRQLKSTDELCHIPVILLTAKNSHIHKLEGLEHGADDYLSKPFSILELKARIKNILQNRKLLHEKYRSAIHRSAAKEITLNSYDEQLLTKLHRIMEENLDKSNLTVEYLGDQVGLSRVHLFRKLKALTGLTPSEFIRDFRMKHAGEMLKTGKFRVADVADSVGFQDVQYFSKVFKKETGKSPSEYIKR